MKAVYYDRFQAPLRIENLPDPKPPLDGVVIKVEATGICRSDWHGWMGHDVDITLPHVPGHELAGTIEAVGSAVKNWKPGDRVTLPFSMGCGYCPLCQSANQQICDNYFQPGFTAWGSFAEYVAIPYADFNLVRLPETINFVEAAILGCRFITAYRALVAQGRLQGGQWFSVHACGGVGLSSIMIAKALGAQVIGIDISEDKLAFAKKVGADFILNAKTIGNIPEAIKEISQGGAHLSMDALGSTETCINSLLSLRKRGKHLQVGLMTGQHAAPPIPMGPIISNELEILGSHGMQAHQYPEMLQLITSGKIRPALLLGRKVHLTESLSILENMNQFSENGVTVIHDFS